ncbi:MAG: SufE family protein [Chloroflexota bacterium]|nr:SufE family protein [Chloroflexota bacterium]
MKSIKETEIEIIEEFELLSNIDAKYAHLFQLGNALRDMPKEIKINDNLVKGCQSSLWFHLYEEAGQFYLDAESDSMVIKGIAALLARLIAGRTADEIKEINMGFIDQLEIWKLASERNNGLMAMLDHIKEEAKQLDSEMTKNNQDQTNTWVI